ncbi:MAG: orotate phosphoribosyltransferase [Dethiobacteria bacterium]|jgi:orotate phosphoribosyltransferase|nr:orotate phosphoribosyltransferase [Bacillota bacterium]HOJ84050.1 orotate phosphoribosyltransferase [Bacillota bacterium]HOL16189.1 orotate phosphoribosyltransferase [Bacillota bacterium]
MNYPVLDELRHKLLLLTFIYSYRCGRFLLSSGRYSSYYIDGKQVTMAPEGLYATAQYILASMQQRRIRADAIGGLTLGADPIAAGVAALSNIWAQKEGAPASLIPLPSFIVRKETKGHGTRSRIEGPFYRGMRTVIVDDVLTTGASILSAASAVEEAGGSVCAVYVLVDRMEGGRENIEQAGYLLDAAVSRDSLDKLQRQMERRYPALSGALQAEEVAWKELPWEELQPDYPSLAAVLKELSAKAAAAGKDKRLSRLELEKTAGRFFSALKAALYHPAGEAEAMRLAKLLQKAL